MFQQNKTMSNITYTIETEIKHLNNLEKTILVTVFSVIFLFALIGNVLLLLLLSSRKRIKTIHNYFLINITVSNLIYTLCSPFPFIIELNNGEWILFDMLCPLIPFVSTVSINLNTFTTAVSAVERLFVIVFPFKQKLSKKRCLGVIFFVWQGALVVSLPWFRLVAIDEENISLNLNDLINFEADQTSSVKSCLPHLELNTGN